ncbi:MAG: hypothetical protein EOP07_26525 [Proteobacteria bacterium]|nr:MAG: hypothetical protein EOP07_26525 [Pseudomonadota bacterium]
MSSTVMSIILYTAFQAMQPCEKVFVETAKSANPAFKTSETAYLDEFAKAACATSNPDILWLLALQETNFRFVIIRENKGKDYAIKEGPSAVAYLKSLKKKSKWKDPPKMNVDIGVMQFNWHWHGKGFDSNPMEALSPKRQVAYFVEKYSKEIYNTCDEGWVGCYHNQSNDKRSSGYQSDISKKTKRLASNALEFLGKYRQTLSGEALEMLPPIVVQQFRDSYAYSKSFPRPKKQLPEMPAVRTDATKELASK